MLEAWGHRDHGERFTGGIWDPPHLVCWPDGARTGTALCGKAELEPLKLELPGTAAHLKVTVCAKCRKKAAPPPTIPQAGMDELSKRRARKVT